MGNLFTSQKKSRVTQQDKAVLELKQQRDRLKVYKKKVGAQLNADREYAKKLLQQGMKERAKLMLKKKRYQEQLLDKTENQLDRIDQLVHDLEFAQIQNKVIEGLKEGNEALKKIQNVFSLTEIEKILEDSQDAIAKQNEINELLSGALDDTSDDAVEQELEDIIHGMKEKEEEHLDLPSVPSEEPVEEASKRREAERQKPAKVAALA